jgi:hypothetical protein
MAELEHTGEIRSIAGRKDGHSANPIIEAEPQSLRGWLRILDQLIKSVPAV